MTGERIVVVQRRHRPHRLGFVRRMFGFHLDGIVRHNAFDHGEYVDTQYLTSLEDEWPRARARWEAERGPLPS